MHSILGEVTEDFASMKALFENIDEGSVLKSFRLFDSSNSMPGSIKAVMGFPSVEMESWENGNAKITFEIARRSIWR